MSINLEDLGISKEDLAERVVESIAERYVNDTSFDEDGNPGYTKPTKLAERLKALVAERIDAGLKKVIDEHILVDAEGYLKTMMLQETNQWGEKKSGPYTLIEWLQKRAVTYLTEQVDSSGRDKASVGYNWAPSQTRLTHIIHQYFHYHIQGTLEAVVQDANKQIAGGIQGAVEASLNDILTKIKIVPQGIK